MPLYETLAKDISQSHAQKYMEDFSVTSVIDEY
jgi:hypothetical protein